MGGSKKYKYTESVRAWKGLCREAIDTTVVMYMEFAKDQVFHFLRILCK